MEGSDAQLLLTLKGQLADASVKFAKAMDALESLAKEREDEADDLAHKLTEASLRVLGERIDKIELMIVGLMERLYPGPKA